MVADLGGTTHRRSVTAVRRTLGVPKHPTDRRDLRNVAGYVLGRTIRYEDKPEIRGDEKLLITRKLLTGIAVHSRVKHPFKDFLNDYGESHQTKRDDSGP